MRTQGTTAKRVALMAILALIAVSVMAVASAESGSARESSGTDEEGPAARPLDDVPGLGITSEGMLRDDLIAIHQVYQREKLIAECMAQAGFSYTPDVVYVEEVVAAAGSSIASPDEQSDVVTDGYSANVGVRSELSDAELDRYWKALVGATAEDVAAFEVDGYTPKSWSDNPEGFLRGGCTGDAAPPVPNVWDLRRELISDYVDARASIKDHPDFAPHRKEFTACVESVTSRSAGSLAELEELLTTDETAAAAITCEPIWDRGVLDTESVAMEEFARKHAGALDAQRQAYTGVLGEIREHEDFVDWMSAFLAQWR